jgi:hypothetical protein
MYMDENCAQKESEPDSRPDVVISRDDHKNGPALASKMGEIDDQHRVDQLLFFARENFAR